MSLSSQKSWLLSDTVYTKSKENIYTYKLIKESKTRPKCTDSLHSKLVSVGGKEIDQRCP